MAVQPVAVPTETVYGLAADATNAEAVARIYEAKGRPSFNPLIVHVPDLKQPNGSANSRLKHISRRRALAGPHTRGSSPRNRRDCLDRDRRPANGRHPRSCASSDASSSPLCRAPTRGTFSERERLISPTRAEHVLRTFRRPDPARHRCGADGAGPGINDRRGRRGRLRVLRPGPIAIEAELSEDENIQAPGQLASHYAPSKPLRLNAYEASPDEYLIGFGSVAGTCSLSGAGDLVQAAARLFDLLHQADASDKPRIAVAPIAAEGLGAAINDRLQRAAHPR